MRTRCCVHSHASFPTHLAHTHVRVVLGLQRLDSCIMGRLVWGDMCEMQCLSSGGWGVWYLSLTQLLLSSEQLGLDACNFLSLGLVTVIGISPPIRVKVQRCVAYLDLCVSAASQVA